MENEKFENQENFNDEMEDVSGGRAMIHVDTTDKKNPAKMDYIYLSIRDAFNLNIVGAIDLKNGSIDISQKLSSSDGGERLLKKIISKAHLTTRRKRPWELKFKLYDSGNKDE